MNHLGTVPLETQRLILRPFVMEDAEPMYRNWAADPQVTEYLTWQPHESPEVSREVLRGWIKDCEKKDTYQWAVVLKELGEPIGSLGVVRRDDEIKMVHIGYCIGKAWWRRGLMSEALAELIRFFFEEVGVNRVESRHSNLNPNSGAVMVKCGMRYEGTKRQGDRSNHGISDSVEYAILAEDYLT